MNFSRAISVAYSELKKPLTNRLDWVLMISVLVLIIYIGFLLISIFNSQMALRQSNLNTFKLDIDKRAAGTGYYFSERKYDAQNLLGSREILAYFTNKSLGMTEAYGLKVNLFLIQELFKKTLNEKSIHGEHIYDRIAFIDSSGKPLADVVEEMTHPVVEDQWDKYLEPHTIEPIMMLEDHDQHRHIILTQPYYYKNNYAGQLVIWIAAQPLFNYLVDFSKLSSTLDIRIVDRNNLSINPKSVAIISSLFKVDVAGIPEEGYRFFQIIGKDDATSEVVGIKASIKNTPFKIVAFIPTDDIYGYSNPWQLVIITGSLALIILLGGGVMIRVRTQNLVLKTRFDEATRQGGLLEHKNIQLEKEIDLRKEIEQELRSKQAEVEQQKDALQKAMEKTYTLAYHDALTGLPNRDLFLDRICHAQAVAKRDGSQFALFFLDLDRFKEVNDTLGHNSGDLLLKGIADRLKACVRESDTVARLGGDEFVLLLNSIKGSREVEIIAQKILKSLDSQFNIAGHEVFTSTSIGIALYHDDGQDAVTLLKQADMAMYIAKEKGRNNYQFFSHKLDEAALKRRDLEKNLRQAIQNEEFFLVYQPQVNALTGKIIGLEALLRWAHPEKGTIYPSEFITLAEETGLILPLGHWIIRAACTQMASWHAAGLSGFRVAVNVSGRQFHQAGFIEMLDSVLAEIKLSPDCLELELTESILMKNAKENIQTLFEIKKRGVKIAIDDFGTGYSSLSYLKNFPIDLVKIDKSFVNDINVNSNDATIVQAIIAMTHSLGIDVLAEGIETKGQCDSLISRNCTKMQGYYFYRPKTAEEITSLLQQGFSTNHINPLPSAQTVPKSRGSELQIMLVRNR